MRLFKATPDGNFEVAIRSVIDCDDDLIPGESMYQLVQLLEGTAQAIRLAVDPDLQRHDKLPTIEEVSGCVDFGGMSKKEILDHD